MYLLLQNQCRLARVRFYLCYSKYFITYINHLPRNRSRVVFAGSERGRRGRWRRRCLGRALRWHRGQPRYRRLSCPLWWPPRAAPFPVVTEAPGSPVPVPGGSPQGLPARYRAPGAPLPGGDALCALPRTPLLPRGFRCSERNSRRCEQKTARTELFSHIS